MRVTVSPIDSLYTKLFDIDNMVFVFKGTISKPSTLLELEYDKDIAIGQPTEKKSPEPEVEVVVLADKYPIVLAEIFELVLIRESHNEEVVVLVEREITGQ